MSGANCWLASYPKSGNTWVRALIDALSSGGDPSLNRLGESAQSGEAILVMSPSAFEVDEILPLHRRTWLELAPKSGYRLAKTHAAWLPGPDGYPTRWQPKGARAIYLVRDPRDVAVSWAHHLGVPQSKAIDVMRDGMPFNTDRLDPMSELPSWSEHVSSWLDQADVPTLVLTYERLSEETASCLADIASWLELPVTREQLDTAVSRCAFDNLVSQETIEGFVEAPAHDRPFFRRGEVGAWRSELAPELVRRVEDEQRDVMARMGYAPSSN